ncbi:MAG: agmatinase family protein [Planctomycetes bacterium]|nr:agmatinase family protein [Planctomycetota bacterium]
MPIKRARAVKSSKPAAAVVPAGFDPDAAATGDGLFGLDTTPEHASVVVMPIPFDATTSYRPGTAAGPAHVLQASMQVDLEDIQFGPIWKAGVAILPVPKSIASLSKRARAAAEPIIRAGGATPGDRSHARALATVNAASERVHEHVRRETRGILDRGAIPALLGGDHASPFGLIEELSKRHPGLGILQIDAHADLRETYEGFTWSHASIFHNVMTRLPKVGKLVQVGIRDVGSREVAFAKQSKGRVQTFYDQRLRDMQFGGATWTAVCKRIIAALPKQVYISFDIDGLTSEHCPHTGTPVPGGLTFPEICHLLELLAHSGKRVVGFDLCEVAPGARGDEWNGTVGARVLYKLLGCTLRSQRIA